MIKRAIAPICFLLASTATYAMPTLPGHIMFEAGAYQSSQGEAQTIAINTLIGDRFNVTNRNDTNSIFGVGYIVEGLKRGKFSLDYGINVFYLAKTKVTGTITQELLFTNLAYNYYVSHLPVYLFTKGRFETGYHQLVITADLGIGPNFMNTNLYADSSLDGITLPDNAYSGNNSTTVFSFMVGVGLQYTIRQIPIELAYRYFNLGEGHFKPRTTQILDNLSTGNNTAQALILTVNV